MTNCSLQDLFGAIHYAPSLAAYNAAMSTHNQLATFWAVFEIKGG